MRSEQIGHVPREMAAARTPGHVKLPSRKQAEREEYAQLYYERRRARHMCTSAYDAYGLVRNFYVLES